MSKKILTYQGKPIGEPVEIPEELKLALYPMSLLSPMFAGKEFEKAIIQKFTPKRILKIGRTTVVYWEDGTVTAVRRSTDEPDNDYFAFTAALAKRIFRTNSNIKRILETKTEVQETKDD